MPESQWKWPLQNRAWWAVGCCGADRGENTSAPCYQILPSIPTIPVCAEVRAQAFRGDDIQLCRCNVTASIYSTALSSGFSAQPKRWTWVEMGGNGYGTVTWDNISPSTALATGTLLTDEPTSPFLRCSLMGHTISFLFRALFPPTQAYTL